uniref:G-protein coupled receptors family 1 profile domain-containing protein n=1 Tax=Romanomermis culicivorax TaxID=13658 RepID=A0A915JQ75_ROMCU
RSSHLNGRTSAWLRRPLSINLLLSLSLAAADLFSGLLIILQLLLNRPDIYDYLQPHNCLILPAEILRLSSFSISVFHLLALAGNHFAGVVLPLHQRAWNTKIVKIGVVGFVWLLPPAILFVVTFSIPDQGFRSRDCENLSFVQQSFMFRNLISVLIFSPMFATIGIYVATVIYLRKTKNDPLLNASTKRPSKSDTTTMVNQRKKNNNKLFWTMILLMGTFILGWMPSVLIYLLICETCPFAISPDTWLFFVLVTFTFTLTIVKLCCNAFIYALRVTELRRALKLMHATCLWTLFRYEAYRDKATLEAMVAYK